jgi:transcriptional regulator with XRE-family HTH domain
MASISLESFGRKLMEKRGNIGIREVARVIGISPSTLSRVERGHLPDLLTFQKLCKWLKIDASEVLGAKQTSSEISNVAVNFRRDQAIKPETAQALAHLIITAQKALLASGEK